jgi:hypothetical protein
MKHTLKIVSKTFKNFVCGANFTKFRERIEKEMSIIFSNDSEYSSKTCCPYQMSVFSS